MKVKNTLNKSEIEKIVAYYFSNYMNADEPEVKQLSNGEVEVTYMDYDIEEGIL